MNQLKRVKKLSIIGKCIHYGWLVGNIVEAGENVPLVNTTSIYKHSLKFTIKAWWSVVKYQIISISNDNTLGVTNACLVATLVSKVDLNTPWIIVEEI